MSILITTSRRPTRGIRALARDLARSIPHAIRVNRGKMSLEGVAERALEAEAGRVILLERWKGGPGMVRLFRVGPGGLTGVFPVLRLAGVRPQREFKARTRPTRPLVVTIPPEASPETRRIAEALADFLGVSASTVGEAAPGRSTSLHVSPDPSHRGRITFLLLPEAVEVGPRLTLSHVAWEARG